MCTHVVWQRVLQDLQNNSEVQHQTTPGELTRVPSSKYTYIRTVAHQVGDPVGVGCKDGPPIHRCSEDILTQWSHVVSRQSQITTLTESDRYGSCSFFFDFF